MIAPPRSGKGSDSPNTSARWADFEPETLVRLALAPAWTYPLARYLGWPGELESTELLLDALQHAGLIESQSTLDPLDWEVTLTPLAEGTSVLFVPAEALEIARKKAFRIGLLSAAEWEEGPARNSSLPDGELTAQTLLLPDLQLRSRGLRFRDASGLKTGQRVELLFRREHGDSPAAHRFTGIVVSTGGDSWSGRSAAVLFESADSPPSPFPASELYAHFQVRSALRPLLLTWARERDVPLPRTLIQLAGFFDSASPRSGPASLETWLELARSAAYPGEVARRVDAQLKVLLAKENTTDAEAWLNAAELLALSLGGHLETTVLLGRRRVEWVYRQKLDRRMLEKFIPRPELLAAFEALAREERGPWALHYLGVGGIGKTMLMRYLTAHYAVKLPISRVDFDFLSPDYPVRRPGQLLLELGDGLRSFGGARSDDFFLKFQDEVGLLHRELESAPPAGDELASLDHPRFQLVLDLFCEFLRLLLSQPSRPLEIPRVILILDTCEELARLRPDGAFQPAVAATLLILERIHQRVPEMRAVFAGRRLLCSQGADWVAEDRPAPLVSTGARPQPKPDYLRLEIVRGFTEEEARQLIERSTRPKPGSKRKPIDAELVKAMLEASPETAFVMKIRRTQVDAAIGAAEGPRYNPFQLALYADWFVEEPNLSKASISAGATDPYVEKRILGRLRHPDVIAALPHLVLLRRTDEALLRKVLSTLDDKTFAEVFRELCQLEWLEYTTAAAGRSQQVFLEIERRLRPRMERCLRASRARDLEQARIELAPWLRAAVLEGGGNTALPTARIVVEHLEAALRLLPAPEAAELWARLEERIAQEAAWSWARQVCERLLAEDEGEWDPPRGAVPVPALVAPPPVRAQLRATHLAALQRLDASRVNASAWDDVQLDLAACPDTELHDWLALRARFGRVACHARQNYAHEGGTFVDLGEALRTLTERKPYSENHFRSAQIAASGLAAVDAVLEMADHGFAPFLAQIQEKAPPALLDLPIDLQAQGLVATARWHRLTQQVCPRPLLRELTVANTARTALVESGPAVSLPTRPTDDWLDLPLPTAHAVRLELEIWRELAWAGEQEALNRRVDHALDAGVPLTSADHHALLAYGLDHRLRRTALPRTAIETFSKLPGLLDPWVPQRAAHFEARPLFVVLADAWLAHGEGTLALQLLYQGTSKLSDPAAVRAAENQRLNAVRRLRLEHEAMELIAQRVDPAQDIAPAERALAWATRRLTAPGPSPHFPEAGVIHFRELAIAAWNVQELLTDEGRQAALEGGARVFSAKFKPDFGKVFSDTAENARPDDGFRGNDFSTTDESVAGPDPRWFELFSAEHRALSRVRSVEAENVAQAFRREIENSETSLHTWQQRLVVEAWTSAAISREKVNDAPGLRAAAFWALEQGELLALRHPEAGTRLLDFAAAIFREAGEVDDVCAFIAGLRAVIAVMHVHDIRTPRQRLLQLMPIYERLSRTLQLPPLADWKAQLAQPGAPGPFFQIPTADARADWLPWLQRLEKCLELVRSTLGSEHMLIGSAQAELAGRQERAKATLPLELRIWLPSSETPRPPGALHPLPALPSTTPFVTGTPVVPASKSPSPFTTQAPLEAPPKSRTWTDRLRAVSSALAKISQTIAGVLLVLLAAGILFTSPFYAFFFILDLSNRGATNPEVWKGSKWIMALCGFAVVAGVIYWAFLRVRAWLARRCELLLILRAPRRLANDPVVVKFRYTTPAELALGVWPFHTGETSLSQQGWAGTWKSSPNPEEPGAWSDEIIGHIRRWTTRLDNGAAGLAFDCDRALCDDAWEQRLLLSLHPVAEKAGLAAAKNKTEIEKIAMDEPKAASSPEGLPWQFLQPYRWMSPRDVVRQNNFAETDTIFLMSSPRWQTALETAWKAANRRTLAVAFDWFEIEALVEWPRRVRVLHWVGRPVDGPSGLALKVDLGSALADRDLESVSGPREVLVTAGRHGLEQIPLLIVQAEPSPISEYTEIDRRESRKLRGFCQELFVAGSVSILMLPVLPPDLSQRVSELIAGRVGPARRLGRRALLDLTAELRTTIARWAPAAPEQPKAVSASAAPSSSNSDLQRELALNVTLFHRHAFKHLSPQPA